MGERVLVHGERVTYAIDGCRCPPCTAANTRYNAQLEELHRQGWTAYVDDAEKQRVANKIRTMQAAGAGLRQIELASGVARSTLQEILGARDGDSIRLRVDTAQALLYLDDVPIADGALVDATETWKRINALLRRGYSKRWIAEQMGMSSIQLRKDRITYRNHRMVAVLYARFKSVPAPARGARHCCKDCNWEIDEWWCKTCGYGPHVVCA